MHFQRETSVSKFLWPSVDGASIKNIILIVIIDSVHLHNKINPFALNLLILRSLNERTRPQ